MARPLLLEIIEQFLVINSTESLKIYTDLMMLSGSEKELVVFRGFHQKANL
jgi:hypothetical protein